MTEDEQWQELEIRNQRRLSEHRQFQAAREAQKFIQNAANDLGTMTLRKAYEMGYRAGHYDATEKR
jgi:hypothetical protein